MGNEKGKLENQSLSKEAIVNAKEKLFTELETLLGKKYMNHASDNPFEDVDMRRVRAIIEFLDLAFPSNQIDGEQLYKFVNERAEKIRERTLKKKK